MGGDESPFAEAVSEIFSIREANIVGSISLVVILICGSINLFQWTQVEYTEAVDAATDDVWRIEFNTTTSSKTITETWQHEEVRTVEFYMDEDFQIPEGNFVGMIDVTIFPEDPEFAVTDPVSQCDAISGDITVNELTAQWGYEGNNLSGQDSSCETIELHLRIYPEYNGIDHNAEAVNEFQALIPWKQLGWGDGVLEIQIELDVNSVDQIGPFAQDDDEEITIMVEVHSFTTSATMAE